jgi:hypothetical protein
MPRLCYEKGAVFGTWTPAEIVIIASCAQVESTAKSGEVIFHFKDAPHPARFGRARLRATKRSALAAVAQRLLGSAASAI